MTQEFRRKPLRLRDYDYSWPGAYFITMVTKQRRLLFSGPRARSIVGEVWQSLPKRFPQVRLDAFVVMPNHVHGIVMINPSNVGAIHESPLRQDGAIRRPEDTHTRRAMLLSKAIGYFKMNSAKRLNLLQGTRGEGVWQRNYYEHVIRAEEDLNPIREYIYNNPQKWDEDPENPVLAAAAARGAPR